MILSENKQSGSIATEFIITVPFFLILVFIIMEMSLMWVDRHFLRLAGFEAARVLVTSEMENPCDDTDLVDSARAVAGLRMAAVAPSVREVFRETGVSIEWNGFGDSAGAQFGNAAVHLIERLPAAMVVTDLNCSYDAETELVTADVTYRRSPKMPLVKHIIWGLYMIRQLGEDNFEMENTYFGIKPKNPAEDTLMDVKNALQNWQGSVEQAASMVEAAGWGEDTARWVNEWGSELTHHTADAESVIDEANAEVERQLGQTGKIISAAIYAVPEELRLIPINLKVELRKNFYERKGEEWDEGQAVAVAPFTNAGEDSVWTQWVRKMQDNPASW